MKIAEKSNWVVYDAAGNVLKKNFKDPFDAFEWAINFVLRDLAKEVVIRGEIKVTKKP